jgi:hypothetical protein
MDEKSGTSTRGSSANTASLSRTSVRYKRGTKPCIAQDGFQVDNTALGNEIWTLKGRARALEIWLSQLPAEGTGPNYHRFIVYFDEAHTLAEPIMYAEWTMFLELRRVMLELNQSRVFFFFLSTSSKLHQFVPTPDGDWSSRLQSIKLNLLPSITELDFDVLSRSLEQCRKNDPSLSDLGIVQSKDWIVHLGRPLCVLSYIDTRLTDFLTASARTTTMAAEISKIL